MIKQTKIIQDIYYIQERLEKYYYPLLNILSIIVTKDEDDSNENWRKHSPISNLNQNDFIMSKLDELVKFQYLSFQETKTIFENFMKIMNDYTYGSEVMDCQIINSRTKLTNCIINDIECLECKLNEVSQ